MTIFALACAFIIALTTGATLPFAALVFVASALLIATAGWFGLLMGSAMSESP